MEQLTARQLLRLCGLPFSVPNGFRHARLFLCVELPHVIHFVSPTLGFEIHEHTDTVRTRLVPQALCADSQEGLS